MKEIILNVLKKMRTDYGNNEMIIFAQNSDLQVVADEIKTAINYTSCCKSDSEQLIAFSDWVFEQPLHLGGNERKLVKQYLKEYKN
jgi:hypothetical protein